MRDDSNTLPFGKPPAKERSCPPCACPPAVRDMLSGWANSWLDRQDPRREAAARRAHRYRDRMRLLQQVVRTSAESRDPAALFETVVASLEQHMPAHFCGVWRLVAGGESLKLARLGPAGALLAARRDAGAELEQVAAAGLEPCLAGQVHCPSPQEAAEPAPPFLALLSRLGLTSVVLAPMQAQGKIFGLLAVGRGFPNAFTRGDCDFLGQLAQNVALAAFQAELHRELESAYFELRTSQQSAHERDRLRALGEMASGIAHDINNSISPAALQLESVLERDPALAETTREKLTIVRRAVQEVARTVSRMQDLSHHPAAADGGGDPLSLNQLVEEALAATRASWHDGPEGRGVAIDVATRLDPGLPAVLGSPAEIAEALGHLIANAVDAMPLGGLLELRTYAVEAKDGQPAGPRRQVAVEVGDSGIGMDEQTRRRSLEPFFTTKGEKGSGLGLPMVFEIAERHGATLEIDSRPHQGTRARLLFPAAGGESSATMVSPLPILVRGLRVLLIDDDRSLLETLQEVFAADGHQVVGAAGGEAGIAAFRRAFADGVPFDLVVTDLGMPQVDGRQVAAAIRELAPATKIVLLTGWGHRILAKGEKLPDFDLVLAKPPRLKDLRQAVLRLAG